MLRSVLIALAVAVYTVVLAGCGSVLRPLLLPAEAGAAATTEIGRP